MRMHTRSRFSILLVLAIVGGCSSSSGPSTATVIIPGPGSTFRFLNTYDSSGVAIDWDTTVYVILSKVYYAGFSSVMMIQRNYTSKSQRNWPDTIYVRELPNGDLSEYLPAILNTSTWFDLPFGANRLSTSQKILFRPVAAACLSMTLRAKWRFITELPQYW